MEIRTVAPSGIGGEGDPILNPGFGRSPRFAASDSNWTPLAFTPSALESSGFSSDFLFEGKANPTSVGFGGVSGVGVPSLLEPALGPRDSELPKPTLGETKRLGSAETTDDLGSET